MRIRKEKDFLSFFDENTGKYFRTGIMKNGTDTGTDPFMASFPELLDVGIMGHCIHGQKRLCVKAGVECYQNGLHRQDANMCLSDFESIAAQCKGRTYQFALGGCGDPDQHEHFREILEICHQMSIVPNFTTSGLGMTADIARLCRRYCGAAAVSWYRSEHTYRAVRLLLKSGVKTNIHYVLNKNTVEEALERLKTHSFPAGINAVVFLLHKPVGLGRKQTIISTGHQQFQNLIQLAVSGKSGYKIGFDSCTVPALVNTPGNINMDSMDTCEAARWSAYISPDMQMMPCSFDNQELRWSVSLRNHTIEDAWNSREFDDFRDHLQTACPSCPKHISCMGGCPIRPEIVLCDKRLS